MKSLLSERGNWNYVMCLTDSSFRENLRLHLTALNGEYVDDAYSEITACDVIFFDPHHPSAYRICGLYSLIERPIIVLCLSNKNGKSNESDLTMPSDAIIINDRVESFNIKAILFAGKSRHDYEIVLKKRIDKLTEQLRYAQIIEKAKSVLSTHHNLSEKDAFRLLRNKAMEQRKTIPEIANSVVQSNELFSATDMK